jgi:hypothetical protein
MAEPACGAAPPPFAGLGGGRFSACLRHEALTR